MCYLVVGCEKWHCGVLIPGSVKKHMEVALENRMGVLVDLKVGLDHPKGLF